MARQRKSLQDAATVQQKAVAVVHGREMLGPMHRTKAKQKNFQRGISKARIDVLMCEIDERINDSDYDGLTFDHYVALFCWMHEAIYDVDCLDETRREWNVAVNQVRRMLEEEFENDDCSFLEYLRYTAKREEEREIWRRSNRRPGRRMRWRDFFLLKTALADWRLAMARIEGPA